MAFLIHFLELSRRPDFAPSFLNVPALPSWLLCPQSPPDSHTCCSLHEGKGAEIQPAWLAEPCNLVQGHIYFDVKAPFLCRTPPGGSWVAASSSCSLATLRPPCPPLLPELICSLGPISHSYLDHVQMCFSNPLFSAVSGMLYCPLRLKSITDSSSPTPPLLSLCLVSDSGRHTAKLQPLEAKDLGSSLDSHLPLLYLLCCQISIL